jgi:hypothetical protein
MQAPPEKLGAFYLGAEYDLATGARSETPVVYDARDLTTHAICIGMTGSGKTGLCLGLLEEAALDRVPCILIDPKGDLANLLLQFPDFRPGDFQPWVNEDDARRKGKTVEEFAQATAEQWRTGLEDWGIGGDRIRALLDTVQYTVFTPGSDAGIPVNILGSFVAPRVDWEAEAEAVRERIGGTVAALLGLGNINADPVRSREAVLLANIFEHYWRAGQDLDLGQIITAIQNPPVRQIGVFDVDTFYPQKDRFELAMAFNSIMASPTFQAWLTGEPLDINSLYYTADGKPRHSIFYIAHLSDSERMFFVTLLLENIVTWMRAQSGTTSLRALLYFDEIFGYFPPTAEPPSKRPLLTLMKQARAFGLGVMLVTQNPVDLDYKGLTNAGTWLIGKLQAERDKARVLDGLKGAISESGGASDVDYDTTISKLSSRIFLMHNVHQGQPVVFNTRWAQSYLRGPLTRPQVRELMAEQKTPLAPAAAVAPPAPAAAGAPVAPVVAAAESPAPVPVAPTAQAAVAEATAPAGFSPTKPSTDAKVEQVFVPVQVDERAALRQLAEEAGAIEPARVTLIYEPEALGIAAVRYVDRAREINELEEFTLIAPIPEGPGSVGWDMQRRLDVKPRDLLDEPERVGPDQGPYYASIPARGNSATDLKRIAGDLADWLYDHARISLKAHKELKLLQHPGEDERSFRMRVEQAGRERRDAEVDKVQETFDRQIARIQEKLVKEQQELARDQAEVNSRRTEQYVGIGESVLNYFLGRSIRRAASGAISKARQTGTAAADVEESKVAIERMTQEKEELEGDLKAELDAIAARWESLLDDITVEELAPRRSDVTVDLLALAWLPAWRIEYEDGGRTRIEAIPAYRLPTGA